MGGSWNFSLLPFFFAVSWILPALVSAQVSLADVDGTYTALHLRLRLCPQKLVLNGTSDGVARSATGDIMMDDKTCLSGEIELAETRGHIRWGAPTRADLGNAMMNGTVNLLRCNATDDVLDIENFFVIRPRVTRNYYLSQHEVYLEAGTVYIDMWSGAGECLFKKITPDRPSPSPSPKASEKEQLELKTAQVTNLWAWLGPVLGCVATVIAAFIAVFCVRQEKSRNRHIEAELANDSPPPFYS